MATGGIAVKGLLICILAIEMFLAGCGSASAIKASPHLRSVDGIPIHRLSWKQPLPYLRKLADPTPWRTIASKSHFRVSPKSAIERALGAYPDLRTNAKAIYIQSAGLIGGRTGSPASAYVVEIVGSKSLIIGGPGFAVPPTVEFLVIIVNGKTGSAQVAMAGGNGKGP